ncbi:MAG: flavin-dependent oxidoreductase [Pseudomonadales bacterium]|nr:flavin-dependent oxidoreductase [Pseudomonadales bacterium]
MKVIIAGAGIGGLTAALSLQKVGIEAKLFEAAAEILPMGVGINILPHAARELDQLGLKADIDRLAIRTSAINYYTHNGKLVISEQCGTYAGYQWPQWSIHRGALQMLLLDKFRERAGVGKVVSGAQLSNFVQTGNKVTAYFTNPKTGNIISEEADLLIGADGLHSATRRKMFPREERPLYSGMVAYRGAVESSEYLDGQTMAIIGDSRLRLICYPISRQYLQEGKGQSLINWIACVPIAEYEAPREDWNHESEQKILATHYANWQFNGLDAPSLIRRTERIYEFPLYDRDPHRQWTFGRVSLLGDAAHPMMPLGSNGAAQAILDARALAWSLAKASDPMAGLMDYEDERLEKANRVVNASRVNSPDQVLAIAHDRCPENVEYVHDYVPLSEFQEIITNFQKVTGSTLEEVNNPSPYNLT